MKLPLLSAALLLGVPLAPAQVLRKPTLEETAAIRWTETNRDKVIGTAAGTPIIYSDIRRQLEPMLNQLRTPEMSEQDFFLKLQTAHKEMVDGARDRQLIVAEFKSERSRLPDSFIDADIEDTIRRDFAGDRNRFVASLRTRGLTPLSYRKFIEERIIVDYMIGQVRRAAAEVGPGRAQEFYATNPSLFTRAEQVHFRQITITQGAAEDAAAADRRAADWAAAAAHPEKIAATLARHKVAVPAGTPVEAFADLAKWVSTDDFAARGGDAGWLNVTSLNERIVAAIRSLPDQGVTAPLKFETPGAKTVWFILRREGWRAPGAAPLSEPEVLAEVESRLRAVATKDAVEVWLKELRSKHHWEIGEMERGN
jgi:parvulin-like peptidyl-prolyl isomerase